MKVIIKFIDIGIWIWIWIWIWILYYTKIYLLYLYFEACVCRCIFTKQLLSFDYSYRQFKLKQRNQLIIAEARKYVIRSRGHRKRAGRRTYCTYDRKSTSAYFRAWGKIFVAFLCFLCNFILSLKFFLAQENDEYWKPKRMPSQKVLFKINGRRHLKGKSRHSSESRRSVRRKVGKIKNKYIE